MASKTNGRDYPVGTYQWHGTYKIKRPDFSFSKIVEDGHVVYLPNREVFLFDKNGKCISPKHPFSVITGEVTVFCVSLRNQLTRAA